MRILIAQTDNSLSSRIASALRKSGFETELTAGEQDCLALAQHGDFSLIVLDADISPANDLSTLRTIRQKKIDIPILLLSDRRDVADRVEGLDRGADDYLCKPFALDELAARVRALARRRDKVLEFGNLSFGDIFLDLNTNELICRDHIVRLGLKEFQILKLLIANGRQILPKERLIEKVWGADCLSEYNNIEVYISFIQKKLSKLNSNVSVRSVRGFGYHLYLLY